MASTYSAKTSNTTNSEDEVNRRVVKSEDDESSIKENDQVFGTDEDEDSLVGSELGGGPAINPTRDALQEGILGLIRPTIDTLDQKVLDTRKAQEDLRKHIESLASDLDNIREAESKDDLKIEAAINKLNNAKKRVVVVANILQGAQDRLNKVHKSCLSETASRRTLLEPSPTTDTAGLARLGKMQRP